MSTMSISHWDSETGNTYVQMGDMVFIIGKETERNVLIK